MGRGRQEAEPEWIPVALLDTMTLNLFLSPVQPEVYFGCCVGGEVLQVPVTAECEIGRGSKGGKTRVQVDLPSLSCLRIALKWSNTEVWQDSTGGGAVALGAW